MRNFRDFILSPCIAWACALATLLVLAAAAIWWGGLNQDEGWYLYAAQLVHAGKLPYRDFFFTQGPTMPIVYSFLSPLWSSVSSPLHGVLGGRLLTLLIGLVGIGVAVALVRRLVPADRRAAASFLVFALLACNVYHLYFLSIPKTYALGALFVFTGFLLVVDGAAAPGRLRHVLGLFFGGLALALASGTRISLVLILPVVGLALLGAFRRLRFSFVWFGLGGVLGLFLTYGLFALDPASLKGLLAAQEYHAARGGFDPFFAIGSVSRLVRAYLALGVALVAAAGFALAVPASAPSSSSSLPSTFDIRYSIFNILVLLASFAAVFLLQLSAPYPYDDYQVPVMGLLAVVAAALLARAASSAKAAALAATGVFLVAAAASFGSPQLQQWFVAGQDRFWTIKKTQSDLDGLRKMAREINVLDPKGTTLLTQDLYLAVETGRTVPAGLEMGPFSYFPGMKTADARAIHVLSTEDLEALLVAAPCPVAAFSGYGFAISAPKMTEIPFDEQKRLYEILKRGYVFADVEHAFGQNATTLVVLRRRSVSPTPPVTAPKAVQ